MSVAVQTTELCNSDGGNKWENWLRQLPANGKAYAILQDWIGPNNTNYSSYRLYGTQISQARLRKSVSRNRAFFSFYFIHWQRFHAAVVPPWFVINRFHIINCNKQSSREHPKLIFCLLLRVCVCAPNSTLRYNSQVRRESRKKLKEEYIPNQRQILYWMEYFP